MQKKWFWISRVALPVAAVTLGLVIYVYGFDWWNGSRERAFYASCSRAQLMRKWDELNRLAEDWSRWQPQSADAWIFRADAAQHMGDFASATDYLAAVPEDDPKALPAYVALSKLQFGEAHRPLDGVLTCEKILRIEPHATAAHQGLIEFYAMTMQREKLLRQIRFAIEMSREPPSAYVYYFLVDSMRLANGVELNRSWKAPHPDAKPVELFIVAETLHLPEPTPGDTKPNQDKHARIASLIKEFPNNVELLAYQTNFAIRNGNVAELTNLLKRVPSTSDGDDRFWAAKGWLYLNRNETAKARVALERALELFPLDWAARNWLADVARREGKIQEANRLDQLVRESKRLRDAMTAERDLDNLPRGTFRELVKYSRDCGDKPFADALERRLASLGS